MQRIVTALGLLAVATLTACSTAATADTTDPTPAAADQASEDAVADTADTGAPTDTETDTAEAPAETGDAGDADATPTSGEATSTPVDAEVPAAAAGTYGSDPELDRLHDDCAAGDVHACDGLYWESPVDSAYEAFALANGAGPSGTSLLSHVWASMDAFEQQELCEAVGYLGMDTAYDEFLIGFGGGNGAPTSDEFRDLIVEHC